MSGVLIFFFSFHYPLWQEIILPELSFSEDSLTVFIQLFNLCINICAHIKNRKHTGSHITVWTCKNTACIWSTLKLKDSMWLSTHQGH